jgi:hypothetical protein
VRKKWPLPESTTRNPGFWPHTPRTAALILAISAGKVHEALWQLSCSFFAQTTEKRSVKIRSPIGGVGTAGLPTLLVEEWIDRHE